MSSNVSPFPPFSSILVRPMNVFFLLSRCHFDCPGVWHATRNDSHKIKSTSTKVKSRWWPCNLQSRLPYSPNKKSHMNGHTKATPGNAWGPMSKDLLNVVLIFEMDD